MVLKGRGGDPRLNSELLIGCSKCSAHFKNSLVKERRTANSTSIQLSREESRLLLYDF
jgi:hypothetical protein